MPIVVNVDANRTCLDWCVNSNLCWEGTSVTYAVYRDGLSDTLYVEAAWYSSTANQTNIPYRLQCTVNGTAYPFQIRSDWDYPVCELPYQYTVNATTGDIQMATYRITGKNMNGEFTYAGTDCGSSYKLQVSYYSVMPALTLPDVTLSANSTHTLRWTLSQGEDRQGWVVGVQLWSRSVGETTFTKQTLVSEQAINRYSVQTDGTLLGKEACLCLEYRTYASTWSGYTLRGSVTCNCLVTPVQLVTRDAAIPLSPETLTTTMLLSGGRPLVTWSIVTDPLNQITGYCLERAVSTSDAAPSDFVQVYAGASYSFQDALPSGIVSVVYRVASVNSAGTLSPWETTAVLPVAQSNVYVAQNGTWVRAAAVQVGNRQASPMWHMA